MKIKNGQTFRNYKVLCAYLNEPVKTGKSKQLQLADWKRYFEYKQEGHRFIITEVFDTPKEKTKRTGNNTKNLNVMIAYLQYIEIEEKWFSMTDWYCEVLKLLNKNVCNLFYGNKAEIKAFCKQYKISDQILFRKYVTYAKSELRDIFMKSLKYLKKKNLVEYIEGYLFIYQLGKKSTGYVRTELLNDMLAHYETIVCDELNEEYELSDKLTGRQNLFLIYREKTLYTEFQQRVIAMLMENEEALDILNECAEDENEGYYEVISSICDERPILSYHKMVLVIDNKEVDGVVEESGAFRLLLCNLLRKKVRDRIWKEHYTSKYTGKIVYPYDDTEKLLDVIRIEKLLFQVFDFDYEDGSYYDVLKYDLWAELNSCSAEIIEDNSVVRLFDDRKWTEDEGLPF